MSSSVSILLAVLITAGILGFVAVKMSRRQRDMKAQQKSDLADGGAGPTDLTAPKRPTVSRFIVEGDEAVVTFDVPLPDGPLDEVLEDLLVSEAVEVTRDEAKTRDLKNITAVVAKAGRGELREVGRRSLEYPGSLPPHMGSGHLLQLTKFGNDPIAGQFDIAPGTSSSSDPSGSDDLTPIGEDLVLPKAIDVGLRSRGLDPATMSAGDFVRTLLELFGYDIVAGETAGTCVATKGGQRTFISEEPHADGDHPELDETVIDHFMFAFSSSGADRGLLVTDKWGPYIIHEREQRQPNARFITRERLQGFVDGLALG